MSFEHPWAFTLVSRRLDLGDRRGRHRAKGNSIVRNFGFGNLVCPALWIQYTLAIDHGNQAVSRWYQPLHPAVLRLISAVFDTAVAMGKPVSLCGEMAGDTRYTGLLLALGLTDFSLHPRGVLELKEALSRPQRKPLLGLKRRILDAGLAEEVAEILKLAV